MNDENGDSMMERFENALQRVFGAGKKKPKPEADAEEIMEGGVPPTHESESDA